MIHYNFFHYKMIHFYHFSPQELLLLGAESYGSCQLLSLFLEQHATNQIEARLLDLEAEALLDQLTLKDIPHALPPSAYVVCLQQDSRAPNAFV